MTSRKIQDASEDARRLNRFCLLGRRLTSARGASPEKITDARRARSRARPFVRRSASSLGTSRAPPHLADRSAAHESRLYVYIRVSAASAPPRLALSGFTPVQMWDRVGRTKSLRSGLSARYPLVASYTPGQLRFFARKDTADDSLD